jgi:hypothetical protein
MRGATAAWRFGTVVLVLGAPGLAFAQAPVAAPATAPPTVVPAANPSSAAAEVMPAPAFASDYGYPPGYSQGYGYPLPPPESMDGFHVHDGFYLRVQTGIGFASLGSTTGGVKTTMGGGGLAFGAAVGGVIAHNLILYGAVFESETVNPDVQVGGTSMTSPIGHIALEGIGPGVAYYFGRINLYLSGTIVLSRFWTYDGNGNQLDTSKIGLALDLQVGKEWWVSPDWGVGIAGQLTLGSMKDQINPDLTWAAGAFSLLFSATYN